MYLRPFDVSSTNGYPRFNLALTGRGDKAIDIDVQIQVNVAESGSRIPGVKIVNLNLGGLNGQQAFNRVVLDPLRIIYHQQYELPIVILVDSLDEALTAMKVVTIADLLAGVEGLDKRVRFIFTTRKEPHLEMRFLSAERLGLSEAPHASENKKDIAHYVTDQLRTEQVARHVVGLKPEMAAQLPDAITAKSEGNFLYVTLLLDAVTRGMQALDKLDELPVGLVGFYSSSLDRGAKLVRKNWDKSYAPVLGILSVARDSLTLEQLRAFTGKPESAVWSVLGDLEQFIQEVKDVDQQGHAISKYALYHQSVIDFLRSLLLKAQDQEFRNTYYVPEKDQHRRIVRYYRGLATTWEHLDWSKVDDYGLRHLASHLYELRNENKKYRQQLFELICKPFMKEKRSRLNSDESFLADIDLAWQVARRQGNTSENVPLLGRLQTARQLVKSVVGTFSDDDLQMLIRLGREDDALAQARLRRAPTQKFNGLLAVYDAVVEKGKPEAELLEQARQIADEISDELDRMEKLGRLTVAFAKTGQIDLARQAANAITDEHRKAQVLRDAAMALFQGRQFEHALELMDTIADERHRVEALTTVWRALAQSGEFDQFRRIIDATPDVNLSTIVLNELARAHARAGQFGQAQQTADSILGAYYKVQALGELASALARVKQFDCANAIVEQARQTADTITHRFWMEWAQATLARALAQTGQFDRASQIAAAITDDTPRGWAMGGLASALVQAGQFDRARQLLDAITVAVQKYQANFYFTRALAQVGHYDEALVTLLDNRMDKYLETVASWGAYFEQTDPGLFIRVLQEATEVAGWIRADWKEIYQLLTTPTEDSKSKKPRKRKKGTA